MRSLIPHTNGLKLHGSYYLVQFVYEEVTDLLDIVYEIVSKRSGDFGNFPE